MFRTLRTRRRTLSTLFFISVIAVAALVAPNFRRAGAQVTLGDPQLLPGDTVPAAAAGAQERPQLSRGSDAYLSVWVDSRTALNGTLYTFGAGLGTLQDIYAARVGADGEVIDKTPLVVSQAQHEQIAPRVGWNGQNWLVSWLTKRPRDQYSHTYDLVAARVSPAGALLDAAPIVLRADVTIDSTPDTVIEDGAGNWVVSFESFLPQEGTSIPRGVMVARVSNDGAVLDPGGRLIYNHHSQFLSDSEIARAGDRYLLTFIDVGATYDIRGVLLDANFNQLRNGPEHLLDGPRPRVASNGDSWFVVSTGNGTRVGRDGNSLDPAGIKIYPVSAGDPSVCWDGQNWLVAFATRYNAATQTYLNDDDIYAARVSAAGVVLDPAGRPVKTGAGYQTNAAIAPGFGGGAQIAWQDQEKGDVSTARVTGDGAAGAERALALGAPRQSKMRAATNGAGFLAVFRSEVSNAARVMGQHLNADGTPADAAPFVIAEGPVADNPSVAWDGSNYLAVWETTVGTTRQIFGALVPPSGAVAGTPFFIANGFQPDAAGLNGAFLVANILQETAQIKTTQATLVSGAGAPAGAPFKISRAFNAWPRAAAFGNRWLVVWEGHANHDDTPGTITGSFVETSGTFSAPFTVGNTGNDATPHLAVSGTQALVVWSTGDIYARRINADGTSPEPVSGTPVVTNAATLQALPSVAWDGRQYVVTWVDQRADPFPAQPRGDIYAARVAPTNVRLEEFAVASSDLPEDTPFVAAADGLTLFSYAKFYPQAPYAAHRATTRAARLPAPPAVAPPAAPSGLSAVQVNSGAGAVTLNWADNSDNEEGFKLEMKSGAGAYSQIRLLGANTTTATVSNVGAAAQTYFRLRAYNSGGDGEYSNETTPPVVALARFSPNTYNEPATVQVSAAASDPDGISAVEFLKSTDGTNFTQLATDTEAPYAYQWQNLPRGYYYIKARAFDAAGNSTTTDYDSFVVYGAPTAAITSPANGSTSLPGAPVTISATAQTQNSGEYLLRMDFYANSTLIGTVQGHYDTYQFTWANPPAGNYQLTARPTSSLYITGSSAPVSITVGNPGVGISGRVTDGSGGPLYGVNVSVTGSQTAQAATDTDGNYYFTGLTAGGSYTVTPRAGGYAFSPASLTFNNAAASQTANFTGTPGPSAAPDPNAQPIYSQPYDGRSVEGPSSKTPSGQQVDQEIADDFELNAQITRLRVSGSRGGYNAPANPDYRGIYVRFYDGSSGAPGAQQAEYFLPKGAAGVRFDAAQPTSFDITLPSPFNAAGRHFVSVQPVYVGTETWWTSSGGYPTVRGAARYRRDRLAGGAWTLAGMEGYRGDMALDLFGALQSAPRLDSVSPNPVPRSGLVRITGAYFGPQDTGRLTIDGKPSQYVAHWSDNLIVAYVPETSALGSVTVAVTTAAGTGTAALGVTTRPTDGRVKWRFTVAGDYVLHRSGIGPDGTIYLNDVNGRLYALSPDGGLKWVFRAGFVGYVGPVTVGADGTIYVSGLVPRNPATTCPISTIANVDGVFAVRPDGTQKWLFDRTCQGIIAGPNVGPDGKIYAVSDTQGIGAFALNPADGSLAYAVDNFAERGPLGEEIVFGPAAAGAAPTQQYFQFGNGSLFGYTLQGQRVFAYPTVTTGQPAAGQRTGSVYTAGFPTGQGYRLLSLTPQGAVRWQSPIQPTSSLSAPDTTPGESGVYVVQDGYRLHRVNPADGTVVWTFIDGEVLQAPVASPDDRLVLMGGRVTYGQPGFFEAVSADGRKLWKQYLADEPGLNPYGQVVPISRARFTADGQTAYIAADVSGDNPTASNPVYSFFYALDTSNNDVPINQPPQVTVVSPLPNSNVGNRTRLDFKARVEDDGAVGRVEFWYNHNGIQTKVGTATTPGADGLYGVQTTLPEPGVYGLFAAAYDAGGLRTESPVAAVTVSNQSPTVSWVAPADNSTFAAPASITLTARASDSDGTVASVRFNGDQIGVIGTDTTPDANGNYQIEWANPPQGTHNLTAWATDDSGYGRSASITITVGPVSTPTPTPTPTATPTPTPTPAGAPTVSITSPADLASFAPGTSVAVAAAASDADGSIARVEFWRDGLSSPIATDPNAPYAAQISSPSPDAWKLYAVAYDNAGNRTQSAPVMVYFEDPAGNLTLSGRVTHTQSSPANPIYLPNALVRLGLGNYSYRATRTDADGYYKFTGLSYGGHYKVEPAEPGYAFYPPAVTFEGLVESRTWDFVADGPRPPGPTPTPTPGASALAWERFHATPGNAGDFDARLTLDAPGNAYVAGTTAPAGSNGDTDISLVKYAPDGTRLWARTYAGAGGYKDWATAARADSEGNVYLTGTAWGGAASEYDIVTLKYDAAGTLLWERRYNGPLGRWDRSSALEIDGAGNVVVAGYSQASRPDGALFDESLVIKYNPAGGVVWERRYSVAQAGDRTVGLAIDADRNIYVTGDAWVPAASGAGTADDIFTVKYGPDGTRLWVARFNRDASTQTLPQPLPNNPASAAHAGGARLDPVTGDLYVFGSSELGSTGSDYLLLKYSSVTGELRWDRNWAGPHADTAAALAVDAAGNAYLTGTSYDGDFESATSVRSADVATVKFAPDGALAWARFYRGFPGKTDAGRDLAVDAAGDAYVAFYSEGFFNSDTGVVKYRSDGAEQWIYRYDNPSHTTDQAAQIARDASGSIYVAGSATVAGADGVSRPSLSAFKLTPGSATLNASPAVETTAVAGATVSSGGGATAANSTVSLGATATDPDGTVARVDFFDGTAQIGTDTSAPFSVEWSPTAAGTHAITAMATDDRGAVQTSKTQLVKVEAAPQAYSVSGQLTAGGSPLGGASVVLTGSRTGKAKTGPDGRYSFANLPAGGRYTVTPSAAGRVFSPAARSFGPLAADQTAADFAASPAASTRANVAAAANGARAAASSASSAWGSLSGLQPGAAINGDRLGSAGRAAFPDSPLWCDATDGAFPDWLEVQFNGPKSIDEIDLFTAQDDYGQPAEPTEAMTFTRYGLRDFAVQYWTGLAWATVPGGTVAGNDRVWRSFTFPAVTTTRIRVLVRAAAGGRSVVAEIEAYGTAATTAPGVKSLPGGGQRTKTGSAVTKTGVN